MFTAPIISVIAVVAQFQQILAAPLEPRQYSSTTLAQPFQILIRPVDLEGPNVFEEPLYLVESNKSTPPYAVALHGNSTTFRLKNGILSTTFAAQDAATNTDPSSTWQNVPLQKGQYVTFKSASDLVGASRTKKISVKRGGASALMAIGQDVYPWYFCVNKQDGTQLGFSVGPVANGGKAKCTNVYAYIAPLEES